MNNHLKFKLPIISSFVILLTLSSFASSTIIGIGLVGQYKLGQTITGGRDNMLDITSDGKYIWVATSNYLGDNYATIIETPKFISNDANTIRNFTLEKLIPEHISVDANGSRFILTDLTEDIVRAYSKSSNSNIWTYFIKGASISKISENGKYIAVGTDLLEDNGSISFLNENGTALWIHSFDNLPEDKNNVKGIEMTPEGTKILVGLDKWIYCFDNSGKILWTSNITNYGSNMAISNDGKIVSVASGYDMFLINGTNGDKIWARKISPLFSVGTKISADANTILMSIGDFSSYSGTLMVFDNSSSIPIWEIDSPSIADSIDLSKDGTLGIYGDGGGNLYLLDIKNKQILTNYSLNSERIIDVTMSDSGLVSAVVTDKGNLYVFQSFTDGNSGKNNEIPGFKLYGMLIALMLGISVAYKRTIKKSKIKSIKLTK